MDHKGPPSLNLDSLRDNASESYEPSEPASSSMRYDPLKEVTEDYDRRLAQVEEEKQTLIKEKNEIAEQARRDREALRAKASEVDDLHQDIVNFEEKIEELKKEARNRQKAYELEMKRYADDLTEMSEYRERYTSISKQLERYKAKIDEMGDQQEEIQRLRQELEEKIQEIVELEKEQKELTAARQQIEDMKAKVATIAAELITSETGKAIVEKELIEVRQRLQLVEREKNALDLQVTMQADQMTSGPDKGINLGGDSVKDLRTQVRRLEKELETLKEHDTEQMAKTITELSQQLDVAERTKSILQSKLEEVLTRASSSGGSALGVTSSGGETSNNDGYKELWEHEKATKATLHEIYSRVVQRLALKVQELKILVQPKESAH